VKRFEKQLCEAYYSGSNPKLYKNWQYELHFFRFEPKALEKNKEMEHVLANFAVSPDVYSTIISQPELRLPVLPSVTATP
jgi:hypothetical protein